MMCGPPCALAPPSLSFSSQLCSKPSSARRCYGGGECSKLSVTRTSGYVTDTTSTIRYSPTGGPRTAPPPPCASCFRFVVCFVCAFEVEKTLKVFSCNAPECRTFGVGFSCGEHFAQEKVRQFGSVARNQLPRFNFIPPISNFVCESKIWNSETPGKHNLTAKFGSGRRWSFFFSQSNCASVSKFLNLDSPWCHVMS